jgi:hypothetical protein
MRLTSIDVPACLLDMTEAAGDVEIRDTINRKMSSLERIADDRSGPCIGERLMSSYAKRPR